MDNGSIWAEIHSLESLDTQTSKHAIANLQTWISEGVAIVQLVEHYASSQSVRALELLCLVQEPHDSILLDKMLESIDKSAQGTLILLGRLIQKAPSWIPKLPHHRIFRTIIELIKMENDLELVIAAMLFTTSILPFSSTLNEYLFTEIFNAFLEACRIFADNEVICKNHAFSKSSSYKETGSFENKAKLQWKNLAASTSGQQHQHDHPSSFEGLLHRCTMNTMKSALVKFFNTFYAIWPCNVVYMLKESSSTSKQNSAWSQVWIVIEELLISVRLHPSLIFDTRAKELSRERWVHLEIHDFFALAQKISAGPGDDEAKEGFFQLAEEQQELNGDNTSDEHPFEDDLVENLEGFFAAPQTSRDGASTANYTLNQPRSTVIDIGLGVEAGLNTPPPEPSSSSMVEDGEHRHHLVGSADIASRQPEFTLLPAGQCAPRERKQNDSIGKKISSLFYSATKTNPKMPKLETSRVLPVATPTIKKINDEVEEIVGVMLDNENYLPQNIDSAEECMGSVESLEASQSHQQSTLKQEQPKRQDQHECMLAGPSGVQWLSTSKTLPSTTTRSYTGLGHDSYFRKPFISKNLADETKRKKLIRKPSSSMSHLDKLRTFSFDNFSEDSTALTRILPAKSKPHYRTREYKPCNTERLDETEQVQVKHLLKKTEQSRKKYIEASAKHHQALKELGLADRIPGKMYDDMQHILKGLSVEKQCELLSTRLRLVNQHLLFERYCRLMHANRNRRLFAQLNQKRSYLAECERLKKSEHQSFVELDQQIQCSKKLRLEIAHKTSVIAANEAHFNTVLGALNKEKEILSTDLRQLRLKYEDVIKGQKSAQKLLDKIRRHNDDLIAERKLVDQELKSLEELRVEFARMQKEKLYLEEELTRMSEECSKSSANFSTHSIHQTEYIVPYYEAQLKSLRAQCRKNKSLMNQANDKVKLMEAQWKEEIDRRMELQAILQRVSTMNSKQMEASQHKFNSLLAISNKQEAHIFNLYRFLEENHSVSEKSVEADHKTASSSNAQPIPIFNVAESESAQHATEAPSYCENSFVLSEDHAAIASLFTNDEPLPQYTQSVNLSLQFSTPRQCFQQRSNLSTATAANFKSFSLPDEPELYKLAERKIHPDAIVDSLPPENNATDGQVN